MAPKGLNIKVGNKAYIVSTLEKQISANPGGQAECNVSVKESQIIVMRIVLP